MAEGYPRCVCVCVHRHVHACVLCKFCCSSLPPPPPLLLSSNHHQGLSHKAKVLAIKKTSFQIWILLPLPSYLHGCPGLNLSEHSFFFSQIFTYSLVLPQVCCTHGKGWHCSCYHYCPSLLVQLGLSSLSPPWPQLRPSRTPLGVSRQLPAKGSHGCGRSGLGWGPQRPGTHC